MHKFVRFVLILAMALVFAGESHAWQNGFKTDKVEAEIITESPSVNPEQPFDILVKFEMKNGWHIFAQEPGDIGRPTEVTFELPEGYALKDARWSVPERFETDGIVQFGYSGTAYYKTTVVPLPRPERRIEIPLQVSWLACREECIPEKFSLVLSFEVTDLNPAPGSVFKSALAAAEKSFVRAPQSPSSSGDVSFPVVLLLAFVGGLILNFMPCIFPILTLKAISLVQGRLNHRQMRIDSLLYLAGVVLSFMIIAGILAFLRAQGEHIGWGFQLQSPVFVAVILVIFVIVFFLLLDLIKVRNPFADRLGRISMSNRRIGAFATGFFAVLIASPCTAPFMGIAIGYTLMQPLYVYLPVFLSLSLGYALPFTLVGFFPKVLHKMLPRPGKWMDILKKVFAIPVFLTCLWLVWVLYNQTGRHAAGTASTAEWQPYNARKVAELVDKGEPVFINFTAKWCITCLANERLAFSSKEFSDLISLRKIHIFKADWTNESEEITKALAAYGRNSIPLYVYYDGKSRQYVILPQLLTDSILKGYLK